MNKYMEKITKTNYRQIEYGKLLGKDFSGLSVRVASAILRESIEKDFNNKELKSVTKKQIEFGRIFEIDLSNLSSLVASAYIKDILEALNLISIEEQNIQKGDYVINKYDKSKIEYIVSSINKEGYLYFKKSVDEKVGYNAGGAARYMIKLKNNT